MPALALRRHPNPNRLRFHRVNATISNAYGREVTPELGKIPQNTLKFRSKPSYKQDHRRAGFLPAGILPGVSIMRNSALRSNLLVPEIREVMDIRQASDYLGISPDTLYKYASEGFVPAFKLGNRWRFKRSRLDEWMDRQSDATAAEVNTDMKKPVKPAM